MRRILNSWKSIKIFVAVFTTVVVGLIIYGVVTHEEPGLRRPEMRWASTPLLVHVDEYTAEGLRPADRDDGVSYVMKSINGRLGFMAYKWADEGEHAQVHVTLDAPSDVPFNGQEGGRVAGGDSMLKGISSSGEWTSCEVWTVNVVAPTDLEVLVLQHELGHCLDLAHDDYGLSIMNEYLAPTPAGQIPPWISDHDRQVLREKYEED